MGNPKDGAQVSISRGSTEANEPIETEIGTSVTPKNSWKNFLWDTWELPPEERWLLFKVDAFVLTFASIGYFLKNIDQTNVNNAFLSGMKEDLNMFGNELVTSMCTVQDSFHKCVM